MPKKKVTKKRNLKKKQKTKTAKKAVKVLSYEDERYESPIAQDAYEDPCDEDWEMIGLWA